MGNSFSYKNQSENSHVDLTTWFYIWLVCMIISTISFIVILYVIKRNRYNEYIDTNGIVLIDENYIDNYNDNTSNYIHIENNSQKISIGGMFVFSFIGIIIGSVLVYDADGELYGHSYVIISIIYFIFPSYKLFRLIN